MTIVEHDFPEVPWAPADAVRVRDYKELVEVLRSPHMNMEPTGESAPFNDGALVTLSGTTHTRRRRTMNRVVKPDALEHYRTDVLLPGLRDLLFDVAAHPDPDGLCRANLVRLTKLAFVRFAANLVGLDVPAADAAHLLAVVDRLRMGTRVKFQQGDHGPLIARGLAAKDEFRQSYYGPAIERCPVAHEGEPDATRADLISLLAAKVDPSWQDDEIRLREIISIIIGAVDSTASVTTHAIDELDRWFAAHPEDRERRTDLDFLGLVIQETLRLHPVIPAFTRVADADVTLSTGRTIRQGQWVLGSTWVNFDESFFGPNARSFDPRREIAAELPRYATAFGSGPHQCIGLRLVLGNSGVGSAAHVLRAFYAAGIEPDNARPARMEASLQNIFAEYPVVFRHPEKVVEGTE